MGREFPDSETRTITYPRDSVPDAEVMTDGRYWYYPLEFDDDVDVGTRRTFNWFGILRPGHLRITVEVNVVPEGRNTQVRGFFARDHTTGALYLMHTGHVAGGARGVSGRAFRTWNGEPRTEVYDGHGGTDQNAAIHLYTHERACPEARNARGRGCPMTRGRGSARGLVLCRRGRTPGWSSSMR